MRPDHITEPVIYHRGHAYFLERGTEHHGSCFGGPFDRKVKGLRHGSRPLHHVATINGGCFEPLHHVIGGGTLHLLYGLCYSGCRLKYRLVPGGVELTELEPRRSSKDWPYPDYPRYLPYYPLRLARRVACPLEAFRGLCYQPLEPAPGEAIVLVPTNPALGMSLWGPSGDCEGVHIVFRCDLQHDTVEAFNQCG